MRAPSRWYPAMMERGGERGGGTRCRRHAGRSFEGGPWRGVVTAEPTDRGGPPRKNQEFNHEWPRNQRRAVTSSEPGHPLPPGALPTTAPPLVSYINILFTSLRAAITRCASLYYLAGRRWKRKREREGERENKIERSPNKNGRGVTCLALFSLLDDEREAGDRR